MYIGGGAGVEKFSILMGDRDTSFSYMAYWYNYIVVREWELYSGQKNLFFWRSDCTNFETLAKKNGSIFEQVKLILIVKKSYFMFMKRIEQKKKRKFRRYRGNCYRKVTVVDIHDAEDN